VDHGAPRDVREGAMLLDGHDQESGGKSADWEARNVEDVDDMTSKDSGWTFAAGRWRKSRERRSIENRGRGSHERGESTRELLHEGMDQDCREGRTFRSTRNIIDDPV
jgi:hypothetical protein